MDNKNELRKRYKRLRKSLSAEKMSFQITQQCKKLCIWDNLHYHLYLASTRPQVNEVSTVPLIDYLIKSNKNIYVPKVNGNEMTTHRLNKNSNLKLNQWLIPEPMHDASVDPKRIEVIFLPMLIGDQLGYRVGYGKGFYDRFIIKCNNDLVKIGLSFFEPINRIADVEPFDQKLNYLVTPHKIHSF
ncbi:MAG: 5-formyltetrahydrofolate cyclo-ligase [Flavobacteriaceae bacterium]|nr:5-formyltetrahydrofolate cyclo-ligase [Flavobacteriaceae bacterium]